MKETDFIRDNQENWHALETELTAKKKQKNYSDLSSKFVQLTDDLSYAQTHYKRRSVRFYLNGMAQKLFNDVYNTRIKSKNKLSHFWQYSLPIALWESRKELLIALLAFTLAAFVGVLSSKYDNEFATQILGQGYVNMTDSNIANGDPLAVYKDANSNNMFVRILINNLIVSGLAFILGLLFGIGTLGILFTNGVMVGVFQYYFVKHGVGLESFLTIWQHGTTEIASIIVAGTAGLVLGKSMIFCETLPRIVSIKYGFLKGLNIFLGVTPLILLAAFLESFYTRYTDLPVGIRVFTLLVSLAIVVGYYIVLPLTYGRKKSLLKDINQFENENITDEHVNVNKLKTLGETVQTALQIFQKKFPQFIKAAAWPAFILATFSVLVFPAEFEQYYLLNQVSQVIFQQIVYVISALYERIYMLIFYLTASPMMLLPILAAIFTWLSIKSVQMVHQFLPKQKSENLSIFTILKLYFIHLVAILPFFFTIWYGIFYVIFTLPLLASSTHHTLQKNGHPTKNTMRDFGLLVNFVHKHVALILVVLLLSGSIFYLAQTPLVYILLDLANEFIGFSETRLKTVVHIAIIFLSLLTYFGAVLFYLICVLLNFYNFAEIKYASQLKISIEKISLKTKMYGK